MQIASGQVEQQGGTIEVSAEIDGFRLWYQVPQSYAVSRAGDPFLMAALLPAMAKGELLEIDPSLPVSPRLLAGVEKVQEIHHCWNPVLKKIPISARTAPAEPLNAGAFSFFSGGVDGTHTFFKRAQEISHVVFIHGFDFFLDPAIYAEAVDRNSAFVRGFGKTLIPVQTNYYRFGYHHNLSMLLTQGCVLASVALLFGFRRVFIPSSFAYDELHPSGSHPLTDPLRSNEAVEIVHDGAEVPRVDKLRTIIACAPAVANLRVCATDMNVNCGRCEKCLRTMIPLRLWHLDGPFPPFPPLSVVRRQRIHNDSERVFFAENAALAQRSQDRALRRVLLACLHRYERRQLLKEVDRVFGHGLLKRAYHRIWRSRFGVHRITSVLQ